MLLFPPAKINIGLHVKGKRDDGFHNIETIFCPVPLNDALEFVIPEEKIEKDEFRITGLPNCCAGTDNLVIKAVKILRSYYALPFLKMHLHKNIPAGSGLGGGSSDAATIISALNRYLSMDIDRDTLIKLSLKLGSDCPFFIDCSPSFATGRGEQLKPVAIDLTGLYIVIVHQEIHISTKDAYEAITPKGRNTSLLDLINMPRRRWRDTIINDFEEYAFAAHPLLKDIKASLYDTGAFYSSLSGSGSAIFGLFAKKPEKTDAIAGNIIYNGPLSL